MPRKLFKGGNYSKTETIHGNTVDHCVGLICNDFAYKVKVALFLWEKSAFKMTQTVTNGWLECQPFVLHAIK